MIVKVLMTNSKRNRDVLELILGTFIMETVFKSFGCYEDQN